jgi:hypothetical protein
MRLDREDLATAERIRRQWPELHGVSPDPVVATASAMTELGEGYLAGPAELRAMLGWHGELVPAGPQQLSVVAWR